MDQPRTISEATRKAKGSHKYFLTAFAMYKNEAKYLVEWLEWHLGQGFEHFYLYNNHSTDSHKPIVDYYVAKGLVTAHDYDVDLSRTDFDAALAMPNYPIRDWHRRHGSETLWLAYLDIDEFLVPTGPPPTRIVDLMHAPGIASSDCCSVSWLQFGSCSRYFEPTAPQGLVLESYRQRRATPETLVKSISKPARVIEYSNAHAPRLVPGAKRVAGDGHVVEMLPAPPGTVYNPKDPEGWAHRVQSARVPFAPVMYVHHYPGKSFAYWLLTKLGRVHSDLASVRNLHTPTSARVAALASLASNPNGSIPLGRQPRNTTNNVGAAAAANNALMAAKGSLGCGMAGLAGEYAPERRNWLMYQSPTFHVSIHSVGARPNRCEIEALRTRVKAVLDELNIPLSVSPISPMSGTLAVRGGERSTSPLEPEKEVDWPACLDPVRYAAACPEFSRYAAEWAAASAIAPDSAPALVTAECLAMQYYFLFDETTPLSSIPGLLRGHRSSSS